MILKQMGPNDSKTIGTNWCLIESSIYTVVFLEAATSAAAAAVIDLDDRIKESARASAAVTFYTAVLTACRGTTVRPSDHLTSMRSNHAHSWSMAVLLYRV